MSQSYLQLLATWPRLDKGAIHKMLLKTSTKASESRDFCLGKKNCPGLFKELSREAEITDKADVVLWSGV